MDTPQKRLKLKGLCVTDLAPDSDFDTDYYVYGLVNNRIHFRGIRASHIYFDEGEESWVLESLKNPTKRSKLLLSPNELSRGSRYPIGRLEWIVNNTVADGRG